MKRVLSSTFLLLLFIPGVLFAQRDSLRNAFVDAESWFLFEEYADAYVIYRNLLEADPGNDNLKYKIGICLLNDPYRKDQAIDYLLEASKNINPDYKENSFKERTAPPDVLYYLGEAYLVNELLDMAIRTYGEFMKIMDREIYDEELVQAQIRACNNAKRLRDMPVDIDLELLGPTVNTRYADINPVISGDGKRMAFVTEQPFFDEALFCEKTDSGWSYPMSITSMLGFDADIYPVGLSWDGTEMILYYDDDYIGNLYYSRLVDGFWIPAVKLDENISTKFWESHASFSKDGQTLYFTSNRKGTFGGLDIWLSRKGPNGKWGVPVNLGPTINTRYNEESPVISEDGETLYFSSYGHYNMGGYDVFYSRKNRDGTWAEPINMGYPINTTDDDLFFQPVSGGTGAYYSRYSNQGAGEHDIYYMDIYSDDNPRMYLITGNLRTADGTADPGQIAIFVVDSKKGDTLLYTSPDQETGGFSFSLKQGIYDLHFRGTGYEELITPLTITARSNRKGIVLEDDIALRLLKTGPRVFTGEESLIGLRDTLYTGVAGEVVKIPLRLEKGSTLITRIFRDSLLVSEDTLEVEKRRTDIEIIAGYGTSRVELVMIDSNKDLHKSHITVVGKAPEQEKPGRQMKKLLEQLPAGMDVQELYRQLLQNSEGELKAYLESLDLDKEGILTHEQLISHLEKVADGNGFSMDQVRETIRQSLKLSEEGETVAGDDQLDGQERPVITGEDPMDILKSELANNTEGALKEKIQNLDTKAEGITSGRELFEHLYRQSAGDDTGVQEIDRLLSGTVSGGDTGKLYQLLLENSEGPLKEYLQRLDPEKEGIGSLSDLLGHLEKAAAREGFTMEQVREAMLKSLDRSTEVERIFEELLRTADGPLREILDRTDLRKEGIYNVEDLISLLYGGLEDMGFGKSEIEKMLSGLFPGHPEFIAHSGEKGTGKGWYAALIGLVGSGLLLLVFLWWKRRKNRQKPAE